MGFWGTFVVHRGERLLWKLLPDVSALNDAELCHDRVSGGWQVTRVFAGFDRLPADFLTGLRDMTGAPVLAAEVMDSDAALMKALGRHTPGWQAWLCPCATGSFRSSEVSCSASAIATCSSSPWTGLGRRQRRGTSAAPAGPAWTGPQGRDPREPVAGGLTRPIRAGRA